MPSRLLLAALAATLSLVAASPSLSHAAAAKPCYLRVQNDWTADGVINGHYSPHCLRQAIKKTPEDLRDYSSIIDDINAALLDSLTTTTKNGPNIHGGPPGPTAPAGGSKNPAKLSPKQAQKRAEQAVPRASTPGSIPASSRSIPLPLLILGAIGLAALLAAASPALIRRVRARFPRTRATPQIDRS